MESESVSRWIRQLSRGDQEAAFHIWERYGAALERLAKKKYGLALNAAFDEQDLAQSVFFVLWQNAEAGQLSEIKNRNELWWLLFEITRRRAFVRLKHNRTQKRGGSNKILHASGLDDDANNPLEALSDPSDLSPEVLTMLNEEHERAMALLRDDQLRQIAQLNLEGYTEQEVAAQVHVSSRTVQRKLKLIREQWAKEFNL